MFRLSIFIAHLAFLLNSIFVDNKHSSGWWLVAIVIHAPSVLNVYSVPLPTLPVQCCSSWAPRLWAACLRTQYQQLIPDTIAPGSGVAVLPVTILSLLINMRDDAKSSDTDSRIQRIVRAPNNLLKKIECKPRWNVHPGGICLIITWKKFLTYLLLSAQYTPHCKKV